MLTPRTRLVSLAHVSNVLGSVLDARAAADLAHSVGAKILLDGCQAAPRMTLDMATLDCDFYAFSGHKLYGPTGIGVLWAREDILDAMPPYQGGGAMIEKVSFEGTTYAPPPQRFEAGRCSGRKKAPASSASHSRGCIRTISAPYWTRKTWRSAQATTARSR